ncbi:MAG TPA: hypothetical protein VGF69_22960 [Thermoanaerobaculia bacterium]|jgi:hypothetical protein
MSTNAKAVSPVEVELDPLSHIAMAQARVDDLRQMRALIPRFTIPTFGQETTRLSAAASVPPEFVDLTTMALANEKTLTRTEAATVAELRDLSLFATAYGPLADELEAMAQFVRHSVTTARNKVGTELLTVYALAQRLAKRPEYAHLAPYVADMRRALGRGRKAKKEVTVPPATPKAA